MPERPDLEYVVPLLEREIRGRRITAVQVRKPVVMRVAVPGEPSALLSGRTFTRVTRRLHFILLDMDGPAPTLQLVVHPMLAGRFSVAASDSKVPADTAVVMTLDDGRELRYRDDEQMGKVYVVEHGRWEAIPGIAQVGLDVMDPAVFTRAAFRTLARTRKDQLKVFMMDKGALDAMGNAYADEVLWEAQQHPKTRVRELSDEELDRLHDAIISVHQAARDEIRRRQPPMDEKQRDFLKVRNRHGEACPRCGGKIRKAGVHGHDAFFCPTCQPETRQHSIVNWRKALTGK